MKQNLIDAAERCFLSDLPWWGFDSITTRAEYEFVRDTVTRGDETFEEASGVVVYPSTTHRESGTYLLLIAAHFSED